MSGIVKREGNRLDATYDNPWGGVASNADASDIQPSQFIQGDGVFIKNGIVCAAGWGNTSLYNFSTIARQGYFSGTPLPPIERVLLVKKNGGAWVLVALDNNGLSYYYDPASLVFVVDKTLTGGSMRALSCLQVINGKVYIFDRITPAVYLYEPLVSYTQVSNFVAGNYCMTLDNYLITADTIQPTDDVPLKENRYNWSVPFGYGTWDPAVDRSAGFNTLSSAQDQISGCFAMGNVGYFLRTQGLSQISPTGSYTNIGISPFDVTDLWASTFGIGCTYPDSFSQYGSLAIWANNNNIYGFFSGTVPQEITGDAQKAIYTDINEYEDRYTNTVKITGAFSNSAENTQIPELCYTLIIASQGPDVPTGMQAKIWTLVLRSKTWTRQIFNIGTAIVTLTGNSNPVASFRVGRSLGVQELNILPLVADFPPKRIATNFLVAVDMDEGPDVFQSYSFLFALYYNENGSASLAIAQKGTNILFREEEIRLGIKPTVRGIIVKAAGTGILHIKVSGNSFTDIAVSAAKSRTYRTYGEITEENPQLSITSTDFDGFIAKISMNMTYDEGSPL